MIVPTRNRPELLAETVAAIRAQTIAAELIVVDDGSEPAADVPGATVLRRDRAGGSGAAARNAGAAAASSPWLAFCDDDDLWAPGKLAAQLAALAEHPTARWSATGCVVIDADRRIVGGQLLPDYSDLGILLRQQNHVPGGGSSVLVAAELFAAAGGFATDLEGSDDWELWLRLAASSPLAYVDRPLVAYRAWSGGRSRDLPRAARARAEVARRHHFPPDPGGGRDQVWRLQVAAVRAEAGDRGGAARAYASAALRGRSPGQLGYAAAVLAAPRRVVRRMRQRDCAGLPEGWREEARRWLGCR